MRPTSNCLIGEAGRDGSLQWHKNIVIRREASPQLRILALEFDTLSAFSAPEPISALNPGECSIKFGRRGLIGR